MHIKKDLPQLTSSKVVFKTFLATLKQITQIYSSCITYYQYDFELKLSSSVYDCDVINGS